jgi:archaellum component FlaC
MNENETKDLLENLDELSHDVKELLEVLKNISSDIIELKDQLTEKATSK